MLEETDFKYVSKGSYPLNQDVLAYCNFQGGYIAACSSLTYFIAY